MTWCSFEDLIRTCGVGSKGEEEEQKWSFKRIEADEKRSKVEKEMKNMRKVLKKMEGRRRRRG